MKQELIAPFEGLSKEKRECSPFVYDNGRILFEPFVTAKEVVESGLFPDLSEEKLRHYVREGWIRAYGPAKSKTYLFSEVYQDWKLIGRRVDGILKIPQESKEVGGRLSKAWRKV